MKKILLSAFIALTLCFSLSAQTTVTITATGTTGSFNTGSVNSAGVKNDGNMVTINSGANAGWAKFDMTAIPAGAVVMSVNCAFTTYTSTSSTALNNLYGFVGDPAVITGTALYTSCNTGTSLNNTAWTVAATNTKTLNAAGITFVQNNITSNQLCIGFSRASTNTYNIYGYGGAVGQQPMLVVTYSVPPVCSGIPSAGTVVASNTLLCTPQNVNLSLTGSTSASGLTYQWLSSPDGVSWNPIPTATNVATTQSVSSTTYYQCAVACGTDVATSSTITVNYGVMPTAGTTAATSTLACFGQSIGLSLTGATALPGLSYQWQSSPTGTGYTAIVPTASLATTTQTISSSLYFQNVLTCGSFTSASTPIQVMVVGTTTNSVPYFEGFEGIIANNQLPNCSWMASNLPTICQTYSATPPPTVYNRIPKSGTKFASFRYGTNTAGDYFYTNGIQLTAGVNYQATADYITDGATGWSEFRLLYGTTQSTTGLTSIAAATGALQNTTYNNLLGTFSVSTTGLYYIAVKAIGNGTPWYLTFDDLKVEVAPSCIAPTAYNNTGITATSATFTWTAGGAETAWDVFIGSNPTGTTVPTATTSVTSYTATGLTVGNTYSVYVRANCGGTNSAWVLSTVTINYCTPAPSSVDGSGITNVTIPTGINNTTTAEVGNYGNYSVQTATVFQGTSVAVNITYATGYTYDTKVWIDFNDDLDFNDVGEEVYSGTSLATNPTTLAASFNLAVSAPLGVHRLRIGGLDVGPATPCYNGTWGSYEDYSINIEPAPACTLTPVAGVIIGASTVNIGTSNSYSIAPSAGNIQWYTGTSATGPWTAISGATVATNQNITATTPGTVYLTVIASNPGCVSDTANATYPVNVIFPGDNVCSAIPLTIGTSTTSFMPFGATTQTGEVAPPAPGTCTSNIGWCNNTLNNSMWFTFVAPPSGYVTVQSPGFDTQLAVWKAASCSDLLSAATATLVGANDDDADYVAHSGANFSSYVRAACLTPGATYYIQLDSYDPATSTQSTTIVITDMGTALDASFTGLAANYCLPASSSSLTATTAGGVFTINTSTTSVTSFSPSTVGTSTVNYSIYGCITTSTTIVANTPSVNASTSSASICAGSSATLTAGGATNYTWTAAGTSSTQVVTPSSASVYTVTGEASGCSNTATVSVGVNNLPTVSATASNTVLCAGANESALLTASTSAMSYTWSDGANTMTTSVTPTVGTTYTVTVNDGNCDATATVFVDVQVCMSINSISSVSNGINLYPNPTNGILNIAISSELAGNTSIEVYDALGKLVVKETLTNETTTINTSKLTDGMYVYKVINNNKAIKIGKIVKH
jgi:hypothetical protein